MLKQVVIKGFRSCDLVEITGIEGILALVGRNGAGKTNILRAIEWAARVATSTESLSPEETRASGHRREVSLVVELGQQQFMYSVSLLFAHAKATEKDNASAVSMTVTEAVDLRSTATDPWARFVTRENESITFAGSEPAVRTGAAASCMPALASVLPADHPVNLQLAPLRIFLRAIRYYPLDEASNVPFGESAIVSPESYAQWLTLFKTASDPGESVIRRILYMWLEQRDKFTELASLLGADGLGLIDAIQVRPFEGPPRKSNQETPDANARVFYFVNFNPTGVPARAGNFDYGELSLGTRRVIRILVSMIFDGSSVLLMEQPEDAIHSGLMKKLTDLLKTNSNPLQFILASHSSDVFNRLEPAEIRLVAITNGRTVLRALTPKEIEAAKRFMEKEGALSDFLETVEES